MQGHRCMIEAHPVADLQPAGTEAGLLSWGVAPSCVVEGFQPSFRYEDFNWINVMGQILIKLLAIPSTRNPQSESHKNPSPGQIRSLHHHTIQEPPRLKA
jgi:hypothetical protein